jgi:magnesium-transporting ATPase (P-type)
MPCKEANMDSQPWLDRVRQRLARQALPPSYIQRFIEELADHLEDLKEEGMDRYSSSRLGEPEHVADNAATAYKRRRFLGRHPMAALLVFGVSPVVSLVALVALVMFGLWARPNSWDDPLFAGLNRIGPSASAVAAYLTSVSVVVIPSIVVSILYCWLAGRSGINKKWVLLSSTMLAVLAALPSCEAKVALIPPESWTGLRPWWPDSIGHFYYFFTRTFCNPQQLMQFIVPLAIGGWFVWRKREQGQLQLAS